MPDHIPDSPLMNNEEIKVQIERIVLFKESLKAKYPDEFAKDGDDTFIELTFSAVPANVFGGKERLGFDRNYNEKTPEYITTEFEDYLNKFKIQ